jgi:hypothetical protein
LPLDFYLNLMDDNPQLLGEPSSGYEAKFLSEISQS